MKSNALVLLVGKSRPELDAALENVSRRHSARVVRMERAGTACARIKGGGVDAVVLHAAVAPDSIALLRKAGQDIRILAYCDAGDDAAGKAALRAGATELLPVLQSVPDMCLALESALQEEERLPVASRIGSGRAAAGAVLGFAGTKGGVGTTTVALNAAAVLAGSHRVLLVELHPQLGSLRRHFLTRPARHGLADLLSGDSARIELEQVERCLWQYSGATGLRVLFGPQSIDEPAALAPEHALRILDCAVQLADYVVLDMPSGWSQANHAAIQRADLLALILERDPVCLACAKELLEAYEKSRITPPLTGAVVVNRVGLPAPFDLPTAEAYLGIPMFGVIPPAPELCMAARQALTPLVLFDPESIAAGSIVQFVSHLRIRAGPAPISR